VSVPRRRASRRPAVSVRAILIGLALTPPNAWFLVKGLWVWGGFTGAESLFMNTVAVLFLTTLPNRVVQRRWQG